MFRRLLATSSLFAIAVLAALTFSTPASAAPYPPANPAALTVSTYDPCAGASNIVGGNGFRPGETVQVILDGRVVGQTVAAADGTFQVTITVPRDARGSEELLAVGQTSALTARAVLEVNCVLGQGGELGADGGSVGGSNNGSASASGSGGGLAYTGVAVGGILVGAVVLVGAGTALTVAGRRRRGSAAIG